MLATFYFGEWFSVRGFLQPSKYLRTTTCIVIKQSLLSSIIGNYITCNRLILAASISLLLLGYMIQSLRPCSSCFYIGLISSTKILTLGRLYQNDWFWEWMTCNIIRKWFWRRLNTSKSLVLFGGQTNYLNQPSQNWPRNKSNHQIT